MLFRSGFDWDDVGSWTAVAKYLPDAGAGNRANTAVQAIDAGNNIVFAKNPSHIALLGVHDLIVVQTDDALLICSRHEAEKIKQLVAQAPPELQ